jgi:hypothetical protein
VSFFDEGDEPRTTITRPRTRRPAVDDRTLLIRRGVAALVVVLIIVLAVLGIKALVDSQATSALQTYANDVTSMVGAEQTEVRMPFFEQLDNAYNSANPSGVPANIQQFVQTEQSNYHTAETWKVPSQLVGAQRQFVQVLGLRYEALQKIEEQLSAVLGAGDQASAIKAIAGDMQLLLAADVIYAERVRPLIAEALANAGITTATVPESVFLPDVGWLTPQTTATHILGFVPQSLGGQAPTGSPGHELVSVSGPSGPLTSGLHRFVLGASGITFTLQVLNSGTEIVHGATTEVHFSSRLVSVKCLDKQATIRETQPGQTYQSAIVINATPTCDAFYNEPIEMYARVVPLPGETDKTNNVKQFTVEFTH